MLALLLLCFVRLSLSDAPKVLAYFSFDDIDNGVAEDESGNGNSAQLENGAQFEAVGRDGGAIRFGRNPVCYLL